MYLYLGQSVTVPEEAVVGIFDLDNTSWSHRTRSFLERAEQEGRVTVVGSDLPRSFVLCREGSGPPRIYLTQLSAAALRSRAEGGENNEQQITHGGYSDV